MNASLSDIKALTFDVFGTCVDFRGSIIKDCRAWGKAKGLRVNWAKFTDAWRAGYRPAMDRVTRGELPWTKIDALHRLVLDAEAYLGAAAALDLKPEQVMMVAAHKHDLFAAAKTGLKTAFVRHPYEHGRNSNKDLADEPSFTLNADDMVDLAAKLGC